jgi:DNA polymerase III sliding clamp (beta) subunit (PCNA family)
LVACDDQDEVKIGHAGDPDGTHRITFDVCGSMSTSSSRSSIRYKPPESIPDIPEPDWSEPTALFSPNAFNQMLGLVAPVARKIRGGAMTDVVQLYPVDGNQVRCTAFDGTRLAQLWITDTAPMQSEILVPADLIKLIGGDSRHTEDAVALIDDGRRIHALIDNVSYVVASVQGEFLDRSREMQIRRDQATKVGTIRADHFLSGLRQAEIVLDDRAGVVGVDLRREPSGRLAMSSQSPMHGQCTCSVPANLIQDFAPIAIQAPVITEQLARLKEETIEVSVIGDLAMLIVALGGKYTFMLGAIKLN